MRRKNSIKSMRVLSIAQPWASCIVSKGKNVENRSWSTKFHGYFAIHASQSKDPDRLEYCYESHIRLNPEQLPFGAIVGFAELVEVITKKDVTRKTEKWFQGEHGLVLANIIRLKNPISAKGSLGFWKLKRRKLRKCLEQLSATNLRKVVAKPLEHPLKKAA